MWSSLLFPFLILIKVGTAEFNNKETVFNKCCPKYESIVKVIEGEYEHYECIHRENISLMYNTTVTPLIVGDNIAINAGIPIDCENANETTFNESINAETHKCYDRLVLEVVNESHKRIIPEVIALKCGNQTKVVNDEFSSIRVRKCCSRGQSYDFLLHTCRDEENVTEEWLISRLYTDSNRVYEVDYSVHCKIDEYALEMREDVFSLKVDDKGTLIASKLAVNEQQVFLRGEWCADKAFGSEGLIYRGCTRGCSKIGSFCLKKCCPVGEHYQPRRCGSKVSDCVSNNNEILQLNYSSLFEQSLQSKYSLETVGIKSMLICPKGKFVLNRHNPADVHHLLPSGALALPFVLGQEPTEAYCVENFDNRPCDGEVRLEALTCFVEILHHKDFSISFVAISISCVFLTLTLIVYIGLPELRNLHGKTLVCHVAMMLLAFCCLARVQYDRVEDNNMCKLLGYGIYFGFVAAFSWLNVMCLDIWWTFGSVRSIHPLRKAGAERRRFAWYSLYAWSAAVLLTLATFLLDTYPVADVLDANMGHGICWFAGTQNSQSDWPHYIFFVFPMGIVTCVNFVLWVLTARHCHRVKSEVHRLQAGSVGDRAKKRFRADKARYLLTGKLWVVMGAGWVWEILSTVVTEPPWLWSACDLVNELQGVSIFLILVLKPKLYYLIRKKLGLETPTAQKNGSSTARTSSTLLSRSISTEERAQLRVSQLSSAVKLKP